MKDVLKNGSKILDVGCGKIKFNSLILYTTNLNFIGSGYLTSCFSYLVSYNDQNINETQNGKVFGIDYIDGLVKLSEMNILKNESKFINNGTLNLFTQDGWKGLPNEAPFDGTC